MHDISGVLTTTPDNPPNSSFLALISPNVRETYFPFIITDNLPGYTLYGPLGIEMYCLFKDFSLKII